MVGSFRLAIAACDRDVHGVLDWAVTALDLHSITLPQFTAFRQHHRAAACKQYKMETVARVSKDTGESTCLLWQERVCQVHITSLCCASRSSASGVVLKDICTDGATLQLPGSLMDTSSRIS